MDVANKKVGFYFMGLRKNLKLKDAGDENVHYKVYGSQEHI